MDLDQSSFSAFNGGSRENGPRPEDTCQSGARTVEVGSTSPASYTEPVVFSGGSGYCAEHESELDSFCSSDQKLVCSHCAIVGSCHGHAVTPLAQRVTAVRNQMVDACEKMQLQALRIERFISQTLTAKERALQAEASKAREQVLAQVSTVREALEEEEQRLLEEVQKEEERVEECLLMQRAHWNKALTNLSQIRSHLVHTLTHTPDAQLVNAIQEINERVEEAEGVGEPYDTDQLNLNPGCSDSKLLKGLWASAILLGPSAYSSAGLKFDENTVSPLLSLSEDLCTLTFIPKKARKSPPYNPSRFDCWPNALGLLSVSSGTYSWVIDVGKSAAFKVGVCYASVVRKGSGNESRLGYNNQSWMLSLCNGDFCFCHAGKEIPLQVLRRPRSIGLLLDWPTHTLIFYDPESTAVLYSITHPFSAPLLPACAVADHSVTIRH